MEKKEPPESRAMLEPDKDLDLSYLNKDVDSTRVCSDPCPVKKVKLAAYAGEKPNYKPLKVVEYTSEYGLVEILHVNGMRIDPEILEFTVAMQETYNKKKTLKGATWKTLPLMALDFKMKRQIEISMVAFIRDFSTNANGRTKLLNYADIMLNIGNYAWMLWHRAREGVE